MVVLTPASSGRVARLGDDLVDHVGELPVVAGALLLDPDLEAGGDAEPGNRRRIDRYHQAALDVRELAPALLRSPHRRTAPAILRSS